MNEFKHIQFYLFSFYVLLTLELSAQKVYPDRNYALINGQVVDVVAEKINAQTVLIRNGKIHNIGTFEDLDGYEIIDLEGSYLVPGMIDAHTHLNKPPIKDH